MFPIKATRAIEELEGPASKLSTVKFTSVVTKMKAEKTDTNARCEYLDLVKHMLSQFPVHLLAPTLKQLQTYDEPCANSIKARRTPVNSGVSFGLCEGHVTVI